jgi:hypothetical protein
MVILRGGGADKGYFMPWDKNKKASEINLFHGIKIKNNKKLIFMWKFRLNLNVKYNNMHKNHFWILCHGISTKDLG